MSRYGRVVSRLDSWNIVLSTVVCGICFAEPDMILVFKILVFKIIYASDSSLSKPGSGTAEGVLD